MATPISSVSATSTPSSVSAQSGILAHLPPSTKGVSVHMPPNLAHTGDPSSLPTNATASPPPSKSKSVILDSATPGAESLAKTAPFPPVTAASSPASGYLTMTTSGAAASSCHFVVHW